MNPVNESSTAMKPAIPPEITGHTRIFAILADPVHHVKTPQAINAFCAKAGFDGVLVPMQVRPVQLPGVVAALRALENLGGFIVTVPHKVSIVPLLDEVTEEARAIGAVNCVRRAADGRLIGAMLDGTGFVAGLRESGIDLGGRSAFLAGAGGAANAIAFALAEAGISRLTIANRTRHRAQDLKVRLGGRYPGLAVGIDKVSPAGHDLVVNATSLGLKAGDALPLEVAALGPEQIVAEIIMQPEQTALLAAAAARGCRIHPGRPMLMAQIALMARHMGITRE